MLSCSILGSQSANVLAQIFILLFIKDTYLYNK